MIYLAEVGLKPALWSASYSRKEERGFLSEPGGWVTMDEEDQNAQ